ISQDIIDNSIIFLDDHLFFASNAEFIWPRDYICQSIYQGPSKQPGLVDWHYFGGEHNNLVSDLLPSLLEESYNIEYDFYDVPETQWPGYDVGFGLHGGNFLTDGFGAQIATKSILKGTLQYNETPERAKRYLKNYCGIDENRNVIYPELLIPEFHQEFDKLAAYIGHIDIFLKFIDEETVLYANFSGSDPQSTALREGIETLLMYINNNLTSVYGRPLKFIPIETPPPTQEDDPYGFPQWVYYSYINFQIVNDYVLVPVFGDDLDEDAVNTIKQYMPGYKVKQFTLSYPEYFKFIYGGGYIHCYLHEINKEDVIQTYHPRFDEDQYRNQDIRFLAKFCTKGNIDNAYVYLKRPGESVFQQYSMNRIAEVFYADIPALNTTGEAQYFIKAVNSNGTLGYKPQNAYVSDPGHEKYELDPLKQAYLTLNIDGVIPTDITIQNDINSFKTYHASNDIEINSCNITGKAFVDLRAGNEIRIEPESHIERGAFFHASVY
ncbi:agmatine deiminase family protein, partial [Fibrobacterota bacterium]